MGYLDSLTSYGSNPWEVTGEELLSKADAKGFKDIKSAEVVEKEQTWGTSVSICLFMKDGMCKFIPLSRDSKLSPGDRVDPKSINLIYLERDGDEITKGDGKILK